MYLLKKSEHKDLSVYDLCGDDHYVFAHLEKDGDVSVTIQDYDGNNVYYEKGHIYAWDSLVSFAKMVLQQDTKVQKELSQDE